MSFRQFFSNGLVAAFEEETEVVPEALEPELAADSAESSLLEAEESGAAVIDGVTEIESTEADAETLSSVADTLEASEEEGGLDSQAAEITEIVVESIYNRLGIKRHKLPALEAYGDKKTRLKATQEAIAEIKATLKRIWNAIVEAFNKVVEWVKGFLKSVFDGATKLKARAENLKKAAAAGDLGTPEGEITGGFLKLTGTDAASTKKLLDTVADSSLNADGVIDYLNSTGLVEQADDIIKDSVKLDAFAIKAVPGNLISRSENGILVFKLPQAAATGAGALEALAGVNVSVSTTSKVGGNDGAAKASPLSAADIGSIADEALKVLGNIEAVTNPSKANALTGKTMGALIAKAKQLVNLGTEDDAAVVTRANKVAAALRSIGQVNSKAHALAVGESIKGVKAALDFAESSLKAHKKAEAPAEAPAAA